MNSPRNQHSPNSIQGPNALVFVLGAGLLEVILGGIAWFLAPRVTGHSLASYLGVRNLSLTIAYGMGGALIALLAMTLAYALFPRYRQVMYRDVVDHLKRISPLALASAGVIAAVGEEFFFRGLLLPWIGLIPSSLLFGALHVSSKESWVYYGTTAAVLGLGLGWMFQATGSLVGPIITHACYNATVTYLIAQGIFDPPEGQ